MTDKTTDKMPLGAFSISLAVKDLARSRAFYEKLGFKTMGGDPDNGWQILKNGDHIIGLFQGMFEGNIITFNPGWDQDAKETQSFMDVRDIQAQLKSAGLVLDSEAADGTGPASLTLKDPDGNQILIDQHR